MSGAVKIFEPLFSRRGPRTRDPPPAKSVLTYDFHLQGFSVEKVETINMLHSLHSKTITETPFVKKLNCISGSV